MDPDRFVKAEIKVTLALKLSQSDTVVRCIVGACAI